MKYIGNVRYRLINVKKIFGVNLVKWWYYRDGHRFYVDRAAEQEFIRYIKANL